MPSLPVTRFFYQSSPSYTWYQPTCGNTVNDADDSTYLSFTDSGSLAVNLVYDDSVALPFYRAIRLRAVLSCVTPTYDTVWYLSGLSWGEAATVGVSNPGTVVFAVSGFTQQLVLPDDTFFDAATLAGFVTTPAGTTTNLVYDRILGFQQGFDRASYTNADLSVELLLGLAQYSATGFPNVVNFGIEVCEFRLLGASFEAVDCGSFWQYQPPRRQQSMVSA